ncbi:MAG: class I SAM-dependent methyltransferase [Smithella sp.]|nr:class I SAM-dependent methyltransferase [Smithella sp.]
MILRKYKIIDNVFVFDDVDEEHPDYHAQGLDGHIQCENKNFWFVARKEFLLDRLKKHVDQKSRGIDIGAGTGNVTGYLISSGYEKICVGELHRNGLAYAQRYGSKELYQFDIRKVTFEDEFDFVCLFDLLEHIDEENVVLQNIRRMLHKKSGKIFLTVPAHKWLWSLYDNVTHHKRRYTKEDLKKTLEANGFEIIDMKYFFMSITPLLLMRRIIRPDKGGNYEVYKAEDSIKNPLINKILLGLCRIENRWIDFIPNYFGGSLCAVARVVNNQKMVL